MKNKTIFSKIIFENLTEKVFKFVKNIFGENKKNIDSIGK